MGETRSRQSKQWGKRLPVPEFHLAPDTMSQGVTCRGSGGSDA